MNSAQLLTNKTQFNFVCGNAVQSRLHKTWLESQNIQTLRSFINDLKDLTNSDPRYVFSRKPSLRTKAGCINTIYDYYNQLN